MTAAEPTIFANPTLVSPARFAELLGGRVTERGIRKLCEAGMGGVKRVGQRWKIDVETARRWLSDPENAPKIAERLPLDMTDSDMAEVTTAIAAVGKAAAEPASNGHGAASVLEADIPRLRMVAAALLDVLANGRFEPRAATMLKQALSEVRLSESHVHDMRERDAKLMARDRHRIVVTTVAASFRTDVEAIPSRWPDLILSSLTDSGIEIEDPASALRVIGLVVEDECHRLLSGLADTIERMDLD